MNIASINASIGKVINKGLDTNNRVGRFFGEQFDRAINDPARYASRMLLLSIISKDIVGCIAYTSQSLKNKKIPEENRGYVAALDAVNGVFMVGGQWFIGTKIEKTLIPRWFGKYYSGKFEHPDTKIEMDLPGKYAKLKSRLDLDYIGDVVKQYIDKNQIKNVDFNEVARALYHHYGKGSHRYELIKTGFGIVITALVTNALVKRTLVPLIATPISAKLKERYMAKNKNDGKEYQWYYGYPYMTFTSKSSAQNSAFKPFLEQGAKIKT